MRSVEKNYIRDKVYFEDDLVGLGAREDWNRKK